MSANDLLMFVGDTPEAQDVLLKKGVTAEDKYRILEARDRVLRSRVRKGKISVELATKLFGTCPDMCPEKERYMRQCQRQLTTFETLPGQEAVVDHKRAVKVYSRSSADQEEPLPHELRPVPTLELTMNYLLHNVVPLAEQNYESLGDWYNFLWDRTRSIRKDITQQLLTNLEVVALLEKCTRFHILCSSRLCELEIHCFDPKLNDENLMKCLQSLDHLYCDLRRRGVKCPKEPEFRAYQIMMNLNEGSILWYVQQQPDWIRKSEDVQIAIKVHHLIFSQNFVAFFRLVKTLSYMKSCILHRYFFQVRTKALRSLWKSHVASLRRTTKEIQLDVAFLRRLLGYGPDSTDFDILCDAHGILIDKETERVHIDRKKFHMPELPLITREDYLIDSKLETTIAEAINGEPLGPNSFFDYTPHNSFNEDGYLIPGPVGVKNIPDDIKEKLDISETVTKSVPDGKIAKKAPTCDFPEQTSKLTVYPSKVNLNEDLKNDDSENHSYKLTSEYDADMLKVKQERELKRRALDFEIELLRKRQIEREKELIRQQQLAFENERIAQRKLEEEITLKRQMEQKKAAAMKQEIRDTICSRAVDNIVDKVVEELTNHLVKQEFVRQRTINYYCNSYADSIMEQMIKLEAHRICNNTLQEAIETRHQTELKLKQLMDRAKLRNVICKWRRFVVNRKILKRTQRQQKINELIFFPPCHPSTLSPEERLRRFQGAGKSPNVNKVSFRSSGQLLDKFEKLNSRVLEYQTRLNSIMSLTSPYSHPQFTDAQNGSMRKCSTDFYRHCWKRRWSKMDEPDNLDQYRKPTKERRNDRLDISCYSWLNTTTPVEPSVSPVVEKTLALPSSSPNQSECDLLEEIRKFTCDAKAEKENYLRLSQSISGLDNDNALLPKL